MAAVADQGRVLAGAAPLGSPQMLTDLYSLPSSDFHDVTQGNNGYQAGPGYDLVTGVGTVNAASFVYELAAVPGS